ncbi:ferric reductase [Planotetraspora thailandica]|uniref:Ferric reductase n=1 Tax=Planotetraspora thailandica TaxID=487172 RepID=A0A8J3V535_9ACTN|nr:ferredoxin reductase family protein [Planotetraspora thailandica]GII56245.1 ferric reductase [Planotetraspora thailandica]
MRSAANVRPTRGGHAVPTTHTASTARTASTPPRRRGMPEPAPVPQAHPLVVLTLIAAGAVAATSGCWSGPAPGLHGWSAWAGRLTGLLAGYACAILVALVSRMPLLDRGIGSDRLARWHAVIGRYTVVLSLAHAVFASAAYGTGPGKGVVEGVTTLIMDGPGLLEATVGLAFLIGVGIVSVRKLRGRLPYELWHYLHFVTYAAIFLAFSHQLLGPDFLENQAASALWLALYVSAAFLLIWYRFVTPLRRALRHRLKVAEVRRESPGVVSVYLVGERLHELGAEPGQFFRWRFLARGMWWTANPYSLSAPPNARFLRITVKGVGGHSRALAGLRPGVRVWAEGPYGALTAARRRRPQVLLVGGGVGISPLRALFETLPGQVTLVYLARRDEDLILRNELDAIAAARGARVHYTVDETPGSRRGRAVPLTGRALRSLIPGLAVHDVYLCGPAGMTTAARRALRRAGVPNRRIHLEQFDF